MPENFLTQPPGRLGRWIKAGLGLSLSMLMITEALPGQTPEVPAGLVIDAIHIDGVLDEASWQEAHTIDQLATTEPIEGGVPSGKTTFRILADPKSLMIGVDCLYDSPEDIVSFSKLRDARLNNEDHVRIVIDAFLDGQSGYIFAVNASGARYDALVSNRGESENDDWDAVWYAATQRHAQGWSLEIRIPVQSISF
ncbi:MAG: carbohydrate binding family 9 domain-containing protein, partial [Saprospiraceae bacterium]|nr:carbohydrate binding family 9 domain-containing protein [Saprospiraceae bacterium]